MIDAGGEYRVVLDLPGAAKDDVEVAPGAVRGTISVKAKPREAPAGGQPLLMERPNRAVRTRVVPVAWDADVAKARFALSDGVLTVTVPKGEKKPQPQT